MPWWPELFSAPVLARVQEKWQRDLATVPYFDGLLAGDFDALVGSFAGEPQLHHPVRGRIRGVRAFETYVTETNAWLRQRNVSVENVEYVHAERHGFAEVVLHLAGETGRVGLPVAVVADSRSDGRIDELRMYYSSWPLTGRHLNRPPLLQPDPELRESGVVADYQRALSAGDVDAIVAVFEPDGYAREPSGGEFVHRGPAGLHAFYELLFSNDGGIRSSIARSSTTSAPARWSTTSCAGGRTSYRRRQGSLSTFGVKAASSRRPASMTMSTRRLAHPR